MLPHLTIDALKKQAASYATLLSQQGIPELYGVTDGKAVGTYVEHGFQAHLESAFLVDIGSSARGIDFPGLGVDLKVTSSRQPQSSSPFRAATQKVYGLGYHLLVFVYSKADDPDQATAHLDIQHVVFIDSSRTADFQITKAIGEILDRDGNVDDLDALFEDKNLPLDDIGRRDLAERVLVDPPQQGFLTISNALQWRLQYGRAITAAASGRQQGVESVDQ